MIAWPIVMIMGLFFMVNFSYETLGLIGWGMLGIGFVCAGIFIFGKD